MNNEDLTTPLTPEELSHPLAVGFEPLTEQSETFKMFLRCNQSRDKAIVMLNRQNRVALKNHIEEARKKQAEEARKAKLMAQGWTNGMLEIEEFVKSLGDEATTTKRKGLNTRMVCKDPNIATIEDVRKLFIDILRYQLMQVGITDVVYHREFEGIVKWLYDNESRSLLLMGNCGIGKSFVVEKVLPIALARITQGWICYQYTTARNLPEWYFNRQEAYGSTLPPVLILDELGSSSEIYYKDPRGRDYGKIDLVGHIIDKAEKQGAVLVITTNLDFGAMEGAGIDQRTISRLKAYKLISFGATEDLRARRNK